MAGQLLQEAAQVIQLALELCTAGQLQLQRAHIGVCLQGCTGQVRVSGEQQQRLHHLQRLRAMHTRSRCWQRSEVASARPHLHQLLLQLLRRL